ncbi:hypothetical protein PR048_033726 [Dryococelus australis]|uniref:Uncharacterized protein n=1 Tax=Dryococelus australis TaxID=614101 RepID=A0ABQ9G431_9NEOP|nr:hypothetical protein PR048_033726 [Dryococelus australis]
MDVFEFTFIAVLWHDIMRTFDTASNHVQQPGIDILSSSWNLRRGLLPTNKVTLLQFLRNLTTACNVDLKSSALEVDGKIQ